MQWQTERTREMRTMGEFKGRFIVSYNIIKGILQDLALSFVLVDNL